MITPEKIAEIAREHNTFACDGYGSRAHKHRGELLDSLAAERERANKAEEKFKEAVE